MSWTKRQIVEQAFTEIGLASYVFDLSADQMQSALRNLDAMMGSWINKGVTLGFPIPGSPQDSVLAQDTGIPDYAAEALYTNLAIRIAPSYGKAVSAETRLTAKEALNGLMIQAALPNQMQHISGTPMGTGYKYISTTGDPFIPDPVLSPIDNDSNGQLILNGEQNGY